MKMTISSVLLLFASLTATTKSYSQVKKTLTAPVFNVGKKYEYKKTITVDQFDAKKPTAHQEHSFTMQWEVIGKDNSGTIIRASYLKWNERQEDKLKNVITGYNSEAPDELIASSQNKEVRDDNVQNRDLKQGFLNQPFTIHFDKSGSSIRVTGIDTMVNDALKNVKIADPEYFSGFSTGVRSVINNEALQKPLEETFCNFAGRSIAVGQGWSNNEEVLEVTLKVGYIVKSIHADSIGIVVLSNSVVHKDAQLSVQKKGNMVIDPTTGLLQQSVIRVSTSPIAGGRNTQTVTFTEKNELKLLH